jgi:uncharacterized protein (DUF1697 family)
MIVSRNPFAKNPGIQTDKLHVTFLSELPDEQTVSALDIRKSANEKFKVLGKEVYVYCPNGYGRTTLSNSAFEKKLKTVATTRNWKTTNTLLEMASSKQV